MKTTRKNYRDMHGYCCAHIDDRHKCINFKHVKHTHNYCKWLLVSGECDFVPESNRELVKINCSRRGKCAAQTITQEEECLNFTPATSKNHEQVCKHKDDDGKCRKAKYGFVSDGTGMNKPEKPAQFGEGLLCGFEEWLRTVCFQKPTPEAYDLARDAWKEGRKTARPIVCGK